MNEPLHLSALIASRICHDLVGPLGAIGNGVELLSLVGPSQGADEMALIGQSVADANARLRFFRLAYGQAAPGQVVSRAEAMQLLAAVSRAGRLSFLWSVDGDRPRDEVQAVFLALQCLETALPHGGEVSVAQAGRQWVVTGDAARVQVDAVLWNGASGEDVAAGVSPAQVQFALLPQVLAGLGRKLAVDHGAERVIMRF